MTTSKNTTQRRPLTKERVLRAAVYLADREGLDALTMRRLGAELGVEAMSLYKHVRNKDGILDGILELVIAEIDIPSDRTDWKEAMRRRAISARHVLCQHSWAIGLLEARGSSGPAVRAYLDAILGTLRSAGFSTENAVHAFWLLDCYVYGHVTQETSLRSSAPEGRTESAESVPEQVSTNQYRHLLEIEQRARQSEYSIDREFEFGLDLILDGLDLTPR